MIVPNRHIADFPSSFVADILKHAPKLTSVDLDLINSSDAERTVANLTEAVVSMPKLKTLYLHNAKTTSNTLIQILPPSLQKVTLDNICVVSGRWADIFEHLLKFPELRKLRLRYLSEKNEDVQFDAIHRDRPYLGSDEIWIPDEEVWVCRGWKAWKLIESYEIVSISMENRLLELEHGDGDDIYAWISQLQNEYRVGWI